MLQTEASQKRTHAYKSPAESRRTRSAADPGDGMRPPFLKKSSKLATGSVTKSNGHSFGRKVGKEECLKRARCRMRGRPTLLRPDPIGRLRFAPTSGVASPRAAANNLAGSDS